MLTQYPNSSNIFKKHHRAGNWPLVKYDANTDKTSVQPLNINHTHHKGNYYMIVRLRYNRYQQQAQPIMLNGLPFEHACHPLLLNTNPNFGKGNRVVVTRDRLNVLRPKPTADRGLHPLVTAIKALPQGLTLNISKSQVKQLNKSAA